MNMQNRNETQHAACSEEKWGRVGKTFYQLYTSIVSRLNVFKHLIYPTSYLTEKGHVKRVPPLQLYMGVKIIFVKIIWSEKPLRLLLRFFNPKIIALYDHIFLLDSALRANFIWENPPKSLKKYH